MGITEFVTRWVSDRRHCYLFLKIASSDSSSIMSSYKTDLVPVIAPFLGNDSAALTLAGIVCQFRGYTCLDTLYMRFRAIYMTRVFQTQALGFGGVDLFTDEFTSVLNQSPHESYANWLMVDLENLGYNIELTVEPCSGYFMTVFFPAQEPFKLPTEDESDSSCDDE